MGTFKVTNHCLPREDLSVAVGAGPINSCFLPHKRVMRYECNGKFAELEVPQGRDYAAFLDAEIECCKKAFLP